MPIPVEKPGLIASIFKKDKEPPKKPETQKKVENYKTTLSDPNSKYEQQIHISSLLTKQKMHLEQKDKFVIWNFLNQDTSSFFRDPKSHR